MSSYPTVWEKLDAKKKENVINYFKELREATQIALAQVATRDSELAAVTQRADSTSKHDRARLMHLW